MKNKFVLDGYTFIEMKSNSSNRPYRVKCLETGEEKESAISYNDAAGMLVCLNNFAKNNNKNE